MTELELWLTIADCFKSRPAGEYSERELPFYMPIDDVFSIEDGRVVVTGRIATGVVCMDDDVCIGYEKGTVQGVEMFGKLLKEGEAGDHAGILLNITEHSFIEPGMSIYHFRLGSNLHIDWNRLLAVIQEKFGVIMLKKELSKNAYSVGSLLHAIQEKMKKQQCSSDTPQKTSSNTQKDIENAYNELLDILRDAKQDVSELKGVNSSFNTIKRTIGKTLNAQTDLANKELSKALSETIWDNLVIAFFGETNAGKSTIIETFRILFDKNRQEEDGLIVGDGRYDFTKTYEEYKMSIGERNFTLIDVPGIEGNEDEFKEVIQTALHKAHCIFYVQGHNKKPDEATAKKIKKYLGDWVKVYSIYNVRGGASNYDEEEEREPF